MTASPELLTGLGCAASIFLSSLGAAHSSAHSGTFAVRGQDYRAFIPIVISGVLAIYGLIVSVMIVGKLSNATTDAPLSEVDGYRNLCAGLVVGLACLASGSGLSTFMKQCNDGPVMVAKSNNATGENEPLLNGHSQPVAQGMDVLKQFLVLTFLEAIGLYGLIVAIFLLW